MISYDELIGINQTNLEADGKLTTFSKGSVTRSILQTFNRSLHNKYVYLNNTLLGFYLDTATGIELDNIGTRFFNIPRLTESYAQGTVKFYVYPEVNETTASLLTKLQQQGNYSDITFANGSIISDKTGTKRYLLTKDVTIDSTGIGIGDVIATEVGAINNVNSGDIGIWISSDKNFSILKPYIGVTNTFAIESGSNLETDENYRFRISNSLKNAAKGNDIAITLAALSVPGVSNVTIQKYEYGIGTSTVYITSESPIISDGILNAVQQAVNTVKSSGERMIVTGPEYIGIKLNFTLLLDVGLTDSEETDLINLAINNAIVYINGLQIAEELIIDQLKNTILNTSKQIKKIDITELFTGEYQKDTGLIDYVISSTVIDQPMGQNQKAVTNSKLLTACSLR